MAWALSSYGNSANREGVGSEGRDYSISLAQPGMLSTDSDITVQQPVFSCERNDTCTCRLETIRESTNVFSAEGRPGAL